MEALRRIAASNTPDVLAVYLFLAKGAGHAAISEMSVIRVGSSATEWLQYFATEGSLDLVREVRQCVLNKEVEREWLRVGRWAFCGAWE